VFAYVSTFLFYLTEYLLLLCEQQADNGGDSFLLDGRDLVERTLSPAQQDDLRRVLYEPNHHKPMGSGVHIHAALNCLHASEI
jgi:hypothetical protein